MEPHQNTSPLHAHAPPPAIEHHLRIKPIDSRYRLVIRTVLWVIAGLVFLGFAIWWSLT
jgi:hypothetical protein